MLTKQVNSASGLQKALSISVVVFVLDLARAFIHKNMNRGVTQLERCTRLQRLDEKQMCDARVATTPKMSSGNCAATTPSQKFLFKFMKHFPKWVIILT